MPTPLGQCALHAGGHSLLIESIPIGTMLEDNRHFREVRRWLRARSEIGWFSSRGGLGRLRVRERSLRCWGPAKESTTAYVGRTGAKALSSSAAAASPSLARRRRREYPRDPRVVCATMASVRSR